MTALQPSASGMRVVNLRLWIPLLLVGVTLLRLGLLAWSERESYFDQLGEFTDRTAHAQLLHVRRDRRIREPSVELLHPHAEAVELLAEGIFHCAGGAGDAVVGDLRRSARRGWRAGKACADGTRRR